MTYITCPNCGTENLAEATNCRNCRINLKLTQDHPEQPESENKKATRNDHASPKQLKKLRNLRFTANAMRWIGRVWGLPLVTVLPLVLFFWYLGSAGGAGPPGYIYLVGTVIVAGMILAWWQEGLGALVSLAGLIGFYAALWAFDRSSFRYWVWVFVFILPPIAFFLTSSLLRKHMAAKSFEDRGGERSENNS
jgi:hypothetical protein